MSDLFRGERARFHKLKNVQVREIRRRYKKKESVMQLSRDFGVCPKTIRDIIQWHTWTHV